jgi:hypothetical protein
MTRKRLLLAVAAVLVLCCAGSILIVVLSPKETGTPFAQIPSTQETAEGQPETSTPILTDTPLPAATNTPKPTLSPEELLRSAVKGALRSGNRDVTRLQSVSIRGNMIQVDWAINDNLSTNLIGHGAQMDIVDILEAVNKSDFQYEQIHLVGTFSMQDVYGNVEEKPVVNVTYYKTTIDKINWDNFITDDIYLLADEVTFIHSEFSQK